MHGSQTALCQCISAYFSNLSTLSVSLYMCCVWGYCQYISTSNTILSKPIEDVSIATPFKFHKTTILFANYSNMLWHIVAAVWVRYSVHHEGSHSINTLVCCDWIWWSLVETKEKFSFVYKYLPFSLSFPHVSFQDIALKNQHQVQKKYSMGM